MHCQKKWNSNTQKYVNLSPTQKFTCCLNSCVPIVNNCFTKCDSMSSKEKEKCLLYCGNLIISCNNGCRIYNPELWGYTNKFNESSTIFKCGNGHQDKFSIPCLKKFKNEINNLCNQKCTQDLKYSLLECDEYCKYNLKNASKKLAKCNSYKNIWGEELERKAIPFSKFKCPEGRLNYKNFLIDTKNKKIKGGIGVLIIALTIIFFFILIYFFRNKSSRSRPIRSPYGAS